MVNVIVCIAFLASLAVAVWCWLQNKHLMANRDEYKELFEVASNERKQDMERLDVLILKNEELLTAASDKDLVLERASQSISVASEKIAAQEYTIVALDEKLRFSTTQYDKLLSQKKSSEVRLGQISEQMSPFLSDFPFDPKRSKFLGDPVDMICFSDEKITFVEIKSGKSQLSKRQREIRDLIAKGKVDFFVYRVDGK